MKPHITAEEYLHALSVYGSFRGLVNCTPSLNKDKGKIKSFYIYNSCPIDFYERARKAGFNKLDKISIKATSEGSRVDVVISTKLCSALKRLTVLDVMNKLSAFDNYFKLARARAPSSKMAHKSLGKFYKYDWKISKLKVLASLLNSP